MQESERRPTRFRSPLRQPAHPLVCFWIRYGMRAFLDWHPHSGGPACRTLGINWIDEKLFGSPRLAMGRLPPYEHCDAILSCKFR